jgi:hypothetical protein
MSQRPTEPEDAGHTDDTAAVHAADAAGDEDEATFVEVDLGRA